MQKHDADTLELASQLLSFSPARGLLESKNEAAQVAEKQDTMCVSVATKQRQLECSRRKIARNQIRIHLKEHYDQFKNDISMYSTLRMWTKIDMKEQFRSPKGRSVHQKVLALHFSKSLI